MATPPFFGAEILVNTNTADTQVSPSVTALANGKFIAVWGDDLLGEVRGQLFNGDGTRAGSEFLVSQEEKDFHFGPTLTELADGRFVAAWARVTGSSSEAVITARIFKADGAPAGDEFTVSTTTGRDVVDPAITALKDGGFAITWTREFSGSDLDVHGRAFDVTGAALGEDFVINNVANINEQESAVIELTNGNYVVVLER